MKFYMQHNFYGGDVNVIEQAAKDCNVQLIAVKGYALEDFPGDREYVEGDVAYLFLLESESGRDAYNMILFKIRPRVRELFLAKYPDFDESMKG